MLLGLMFTVSAMILSYKAAEMVSIRRYRAEYRLARVKQDISAEKFPMRVNMD